MGLGGGGGGAVVGFDVVVLDVVGVGSGLLKSVLELSSLKEKRAFIVWPYYGIWYFDQFIIETLR